ncbi:MAG: hypothetical protein ACREQF_09515 [Candidatus Binataceae bacterium]
MQPQNPESEDEKIDGLLSEADPNEPHKLAAMARPAVTEVSGYKFHAFNAGRKLLLILAGIDQKLIETFTKLEQTIGDQKVADLDETALGKLLIKTDPQAYFHFAALAFVCVQDGPSLAPYRLKPDTLETAVFSWLDALADDVAASLINKSAAVFFESSVGLDFQVVTDARLPDPNGPSLAGRRSTSPRSARPKSPKTKMTRSGAKSHSAAAGSISTPP